MCGIVGYISNEKVENTLINKLKLLEYRGYDSSGIAVKNNKEIKISKAVGEIKNLEGLITKLKGANLGIAHTRWATHGKPTEFNAHPHYSNDNDWALVHNGIIENYEKLKNELIKSGFSFYSQTDTETIANLLEKNLKCEKYDNQTMLKTLKKTIDSLKGSYALNIINKNYEGILFAKQKSPLYLAKNENSVLIASDPICFIGFSDKYITLHDGDYGYATKTELCIYNENDLIKPKYSTLDATEYSIKTKYKHFMIKEISEEKFAISNIYSYYSDESAFNNLTTPSISEIKDIKIVGCGSAYHAGLIGASMFEKELGIECNCYLASEFRYKNPILTKNTLVIFISQSGETADTLGAHELAKSKGAKTLAIVNVEYSTLFKSADISFPIKAGAEISVASTKAFVSQLAVLYCLSKKFASIMFNKKYSIENLKSIIPFIERKSHKELKEIAEHLFDKQNIFMIGRGDDCFIAQEACLKIKETSYINANAYFAGELKHGFIALISEGTFVIVFATNKDILSKTLANAEETRARGAKLILVTNEVLSAQDKKKFFKVVKVQKVDSSLQPILNIIPWQIISYYMSTTKGYNPDKPRNLAKSVTVE